MKCVAITLIANAVLLTASTAPAATVIEAERAAVRTEGGEVDGGIWNLWSNGRFAFRGFHGTYRISAEVDGKRIVEEFQLTRDGPNRITLR